ncbi:MAG: hypothetical protein KDA62_21105, partial [Planctomycetales bacterium]|nr:hypothetical protein [Planctomycetales bacterium]
NASNGLDRPRRDSSQSELTDMQTVGVLARMTERHGTTASELLAKAIEHGWDIRFRDEYWFWGFGVPFSDAALDDRAIVIDTDRSWLPTGHVHDSNVLADRLFAALKWADENDRLHPDEDDPSVLQPGDFPTYLTGRTQLEALDGAKHTLAQEARAQAETHAVDATLNYASVGSFWLLGTVIETITDTGRTIRRIKLSGRVELTEWRRLNKVDVHVGNKEKPWEAAIGTQLQTALGKLERISNQGTKGDFIIVDGQNKGKRVDLLFAFKDQHAVDKANYYFEKNWPTTATEIVEHIKHNDIVPLNFQELTSSAKTRILNFLKTLSQRELDKVIILE